MEWGSVSWVATTPDDTLVPPGPGPTAWYRLVTAIGHASPDRGLRVSIECTVRLDPARLAPRGRPATTDDLRGHERPIAVGIVDDHPAIVASVAAAVDAADDMVVAGTASTLAGAVALLEPGAAGLGPIDVLLCDIQLADGPDGLRLLSMLGSDQRTGSGAPAVVILSGFDQPSLIRTAFERGAAGYLSKSASLDEILVDHPDRRRGRDVIQRQRRPLGPDRAATAVRSRAPGHRVDQRRRLERRGGRGPRPLGEDDRKPPAPAVRPIRRPVENGARGPRDPRGLGRRDATDMTARAALIVAALAAIVATAILTVLRLGAAASSGPPDPASMIWVLFAAAALCIAGLSHRRAPSMAWIAIVVALTIATLDIAAFGREHRSAMSPETWHWLVAVTCLGALAATFAAAAYALEPGRRFAGWVGPVAAIVVAIVALACIWAIATADPSPPAEPASPLGTLSVATRTLIVAVAVLLGLGILGDLRPAVRRTRVRLGEGGDADG